MYIQSDYTYFRIDELCIKVFSNNALYLPEMSSRYYKFEVTTFLNFKICTKNLGFQFNYFTSLIVRFFFFRPLRLLITCLSVEGFVSTVSKTVFSSYGKSSFNSPCYGSNRMQDSYIANTLNTLNVQVRVVA